MPKKIPAHLHATTRMKFEAILEFSTRFDVKKMCEVLGVSRNSYYRWLKIQKQRDEKYFMGRRYNVYKDQCGMGISCSGHGPVQ